MKNIFIGLMLFGGVYSFAQEAGKAGELLKNEASKTEMQSSRTNGFENKTNTQNNSGFRNQNNKNSGFRNPDYQWNQNYGYAEVFLRIPEQGYFTVELGDQTIANGSGKYRFFDLRSGRIPIAIYDQGYLIYRTTLVVRNNNRLVLDFFTNYGLYLLDSYPVKSQSYGFNDWNDIWNDPYGNHGNDWDNLGVGNNFNVMNASTFSQFFDMLKKNASFDEDKLSFINQQSRTTSFTSQQIGSLVKSLSFDKNKLNLAKSLYSKCADREKYFIVYDAFDFDSSKRELMDFISKSK
ncbi:hypothetical protein CEY12_05365 [Chryseobacterium sp. T16E-39]|uniref:DUF4476 domain-containing protein n=1 Tax=Chryseobacterium sp. T16E-39 TaxID=2015076 RepID=UPI000B5B3F15|nr:DUF4476 domain-containing protein [Chryseobacterium sp. T16E-39]ASK29568.1 hypothetical protein CEY12_05365 [Chryseobacterium sp. T16E-39]